MNKKTAGVVVIWPKVGWHSFEMRGVALFQLIEPRKLKVEIFPDKTATQVTGFTSAALMYER